MNWSATTEREMRKYEDWLSSMLEQVRRLHRQRDRPATSLLDKSEPVQLVVDDGLDDEVVCCALCARDHDARPGPELRALDRPGSPIVCWACGIELAPELAAKVLATRSDHLERDALNLLSISAKWLADHVAQLGAGDRADFFEKRCEELRNELRRLKDERFADPATWLP